MKIYEKPGILSAKTVMRVHQVTGMPIMEAKHFLEQASPVFYERFLMAVEVQYLKTYHFLTDPIENDPNMKDIMKQVEKQAEAELQNYKKQVERETEAYTEELRNLIRSMGLCHRFWHIKKSILKEQYNIEWFSPSDLNPGTCFR